MRPSVYPSDWLMRDETPPLSGFGRRLLAEGDSWFTIGSLNLAAASNVLFPLEFTQSTVIVNCAYPGDTLQHIADNVNDPYFDRLLRQPRFQRYWEAVLLSGGGNDLIDAARHRAVNADGSAAGLQERVLLTPAEADIHKPGDSTAARFVSEPGWTALADYIVASVRGVVARRDQGDSAGRPLIMHTYSVPTVYASGTVGSPEGWLFPALRDVGIPPGLRQGVATELFQRLRRLLLGLATDSGQPTALPHVHVFDSASLVQLTPADPADVGISGDWVNEIHPNPEGYKKIGKVFGPYIEQVLAGYG